MTDIRCYFCGSKEDRYWAFKDNKKEIYLCEKCFDKVMVWLIEKYKQEVLEKKV